MRRLGAKGDGISKDTASIQQAVEEAAKQGGGTVFFPPGKYLCGTIRLRNHVTIEIGPGAAVLFSLDNNDFEPYEKLNYNSYADNETTYAHHALFLADGVTDVSIQGLGVIDGNRTKRGGPKPIAFKNCSHVAVRDVRIVNAPNYCVSLLGCEYVRVDGVTIQHAFADGIDPDCSRFVQISNCFVESHDDAICLKTSLALGKKLPTEHVAITNCILNSSSNNFKMGTESSGDFRDIVVTNCAMFRRTDDKDNSGIAIETVDGSSVDGVMISNINMSNVHNPIFIRLGNRGRGLQLPVPGSLRNISISGVVSTGAEMTASVTGLPGHSVQDVHMENIRISMVGGVAKPTSLEVPELPNKYPESNMFGVLPAHGLFARHVANLTMRDWRIDCERYDGRPAIVCEDLVTSSIKDVAFSSSNRETAVIQMRNAIGVTIQGCRVLGTPPIFVEIRGNESDAISVFGNDTKNVGKLILAAKEVPRSAVIRTSKSR